MKTNFPYTAIHQLLFFSFSDSGVSIFRIYLFIFHMQGVQKIRILQFFFSFLTKLMWKPQNGYIESAKEEANKRTVLNRRTYSKPSGRRTGQKHGHNGGKGKNGGDNNGSPDRKKGRGSNPRCPESEGTGSKCPPPRSQPTDPG